MRTLNLLSLLLFIALYSCANQKQDNDQLYKKVQALENQVATLQKDLNATKLKTQISNSLLFNSPLEQFFQSDEFWENPIDVAKEECHKRCIKILQQRRESCSKIENESERLKCYQDALTSASNCHRECSKL